VLFRVVWYFCGPFISLLNCSSADWFGWCEWMDKQRKASCFAIPNSIPSLFVGLDGFHFHISFMGSFPFPLVRAGGSCLFLHFRKVSVVSVIHKYFPLLGVLMITIVVTMTV